MCGSAEASWRSLFLATNALLPHHMQFCHEVGPHSFTSTDNKQMWQPCTFNNSWSLWSTLPRQTWSSMTRPDPIPETELGKCETREIIIVLFFPVVANSRHFTLVLGEFRSFFCAFWCQFFQCKEFSVLNFTLLPCLVQGIFWWICVYGSLGQYAA